MNRVIIALALAAGLGAPALAQSAPRDPVEVIARADADGDGMISRQEVAIARGQVFARLDRNANGILDDADLPSRPFARRATAGRFEEMRASFDMNGDGNIDELEFINGPSPVFDQVDANGDGFVSEPEIDAAVAAR